MGKTIAQLDALGAAPAPDDRLELWDESAGKSVWASVAELLSALAGERLLSTTTVDLDDETPQDIYTVPAGKTLVLTRAFARDGSVLMADGQSTQLWILGAGATAMSVILAGGVEPDSCLPAHAGGNARTVGAGSVVQARPNIAYGSAATATVDLFGYLY